MIMAKKKAFGERSDFYSLTCIVFFDSQYKLSN